MAAISHFWIAGALGVVIAFIYTVVLLPAILSLIPVKKRQRREQARTNGILDRFLRGAGTFSIHHRGMILITGFLILSVSVWGITDLRFSHNDLDGFSEDSHFYISTRTIDREMKGSVAMEVVLDTGVENRLHDPDFLKKLDESEQAIDQIRINDLFVGKTVSITSIVKETNKALHQNRDSYYSIPDNRQLVAQELLLFENGGAEDLQDVTDSLFSAARLSIKAPFTDAWYYVALIDEVTTYLKQQFPDTEITVTGMMMLFAQALKKVIVSMAESYLIVFTVITILMVILIGRVRIGLVSMISNIFPVIVILGIMGWFGIPLDFFNIMLSSIIVGIAVDDTIHFFHNFRKYFEESNDPVQAIQNTFVTTGCALITTTIVLCCGFYIYILSDMKSLFTFGFLTGTAILLALLADFLLAPALLITLNPRR